MRGLAERLRVDHQRGGQGVEGLDDLGLGEGALDLLAEGVGVLDEQGGREALRRSRAGWRCRRSTLPARLSAPARPSTSRVAAPEEALTTSSAPAAASAKVASATPGWSPCQAENGGLPMPSGSVRASVASRVAGADHDGVAELVQAAGDRLADHAGAENCDVHEGSFERVEWVDRSVCRRRGR